MSEALEQDDMQEIIDDFLMEADELLEGLDQKFVTLEDSPEDEALLNDIFRSMHTIKGAAGFLGFNDVVEVAHKSENILNKLRKKDLGVTPVIMDALLRARDMLSLLLGHIKEKDSVKEDISLIVEELKGAEEGNPVLSVGDADDRSKMLGEILIEDKVISEQQLKEGLAVQGGADKIGDVIVRKGFAEEKDIHAALNKQKKDNQESTIRVDIKRLDDLLNMVGELVLGRNMLMRIVNGCEARYGGDETIEELKQTTYNLNLITTDLQVKVMKTRMQPISKVFNRFPRMVRDISKAKNKEIELIISGGDTEMDKTVIEEIGDPLVHLIRNSIDHGIEHPDERTAAGKAPVGKLLLSAAQKGGNIIISIEDNGRGINTDKIKAKAIRDGSFAQSELEGMNERELMNLIFQPGFSTAEKVTDVSGRGVGMDVVRTNINRLNGSIDIDSRLGQGTTMTLTLPLTLAIIQSLMLQVGGETYAIPLSSVVEIVRTGDSEIKEIEGREVVYSRGQLYPLVRLAGILGVEAGTEEKASCVVIVCVGDKNYALLVDNLLGQEEVVIKSMGGYLTDTKGISGATITGDGRVVLILDLPALLAASDRRIV